jgi:hypothetical protein
MKYILYPIVAPSSRRGYKCPVQKLDFAFEDFQFSRFPVARLSFELWRFASAAPQQYWIDEAGHP